jgi:hypothetical protein
MCTMNSKSDYLFPTGLACKYWTRTEGAGSDKHTSLLCSSIGYFSKRPFSAFPMTNTQAYSNAVFVTSVKSFLVDSPD